jgi:predicted nucleotidyltransferase
MFKKEYELLLPLIKHPWRRMTLRQIKTELSKTSESYVYNSLQKFLKAGILISNKVGNQVLYFLNLKSNKCLSYISAISEYDAWNKDHIPYALIQNIMSKIDEPSFCFIITGSYAKNTQQKKSDIDIVLLTETKAKKKELTSELHYATELSIPKSHLYVFTYDEYYAMLVNNSANYGKEISNNNLILRSASTYYKIIFKAIEHGYNNHKLFRESGK